MSNEDDSSDYEDAVESHSSQSGQNATQRQTGGQQTPDQSDSSDDESSQTRRSSEQRQSLGGQIAKGQPIQIAKISEDRKLSLDMSALEKIVLNERVSDKPVVVVSIAGDLRKGKSFMLNFFLRYLQSDCGSRPDWIGRQSNDPLKGFSWRGGSKRDTTGIVMWSEPFIIRKTNGEEVAVLLMDTQGTFDSEHTVKEAAIIFALSLLTSSLFIYNLKHQLQENYLDYLHVFAEYGLLVLQNNENVKPFQKLVFLMRDWNFPYEHPYGQSGGEQYLEWYLKKMRTEKNQRVRLFIERCFSEATCFLMPYPGNKVATSQDFKGRISNIDPEFVKCLEEFVPLMLGPQRLVVKDVGGVKVTGRILLEYFKTYANIFSGDTLPEPKTMLEALAEVNHLAAMSAAEKHYMQCMEEICGGDNPYMNPLNLVKFHLRHKKEAQNIFDKTPKMGGLDYSQHYRDTLRDRLDRHFQHYQAQNANKDWFRMIRMPLYMVSGIIVSFILYYLSLSVGITPLAHICFIICAILIGVFSAWVWALQSGVQASLAIMIAVGAIMALLAISVLFRSHIFHLILGAGRQRN